MEQERLASAAAFEADVNENELSLTMRQRVVFGATYQLYNTSSLKFVEVQNDMVEIADISSIIDCI
eukprot:SAG11_NODE_32_length_22830_cov_17.507941_10_plen_66_part_00